MSPSPAVDAVPAPTGGTPGTAVVRLAVVQAPMHWTIAANLAVIDAAMQVAARRGADVCVLSELALTGFHRQIRAEALPGQVEPAIDRIRACCRAIGIGCALGAPTFGPGGAVYNSYLLLDADGACVGQVDKTGLTVAEATFFHSGRGRPVSVLHGHRTSAVLCREVEDLALVHHHLPAGAAELIFWPGLMGRAPEGEDLDIAALARRLAIQSKAWVVQCNWPKALNLSGDSPFQSELGGSRVIAPDGELRLRLPLCEAGVATFDLGASAFEWDAWPDT